MTFDEFVATARMHGIPSRVWAHSAAAGDELATVMESLGRFDVGVEIGTYEGVGACVLSRFCREVHTFDTKDHGYFQRVLKLHGVSNVTRHLGRPTLPESFDFAFVDARHDYGGVAENFMMVRGASTILIHDCFAKYPGVERFCAEIGATRLRKHFAVWRR